MPPTDWPLAILALAIGAYWATVILLVAYKRLRFGQSAGLWPKKAKERRLWLIIGPVVLGWITLPLLAWFAPTAWNRGLIQSSLHDSIRWLAAGLAVLLYLRTLACWIQMGRSWSMAIVPGQKSALVTTGIYGWVRHPIYALSLALMICSILVLPSPPMLLIAVLHFIGFNRKAHYEEAHLTKEFGPEYEAYCRRVGRFWPRGRMIETNQKPS
jgi:protein-S-isoprenylcysteine O-methyltransferase Ste14